MLLSEKFAEEHAMIDGKGRSGSDAAASPRHRVCFFLFAVLFVQL
jgi:hypothetical protein